MSTTGPRHARLSRLVGEGIELEHTIATTDLAHRLDEVFGPLDAWTRDTTALVEDLLAEGSSARLSFRSIEKANERTAPVAALKALVRDVLDRESKGSIDGNGRTRALEEIRMAYGHTVLQRRSFLQELLRQEEHAGGTKRSVVFYSWQSDRDEASNKVLIRDALEQACARLGNTLEEAPRVESGFEGVAGSPDGATAILEQIRSAALFVADITSVARLPHRPADGRIKHLSNSNVMLELGFAYAAVGPERVVLVANTAYGSIEDLPFDLRGRPIEAYHCEPEDSKRAEQVRTLSAILEERIQRIMSPTRLIARPGNGGSVSIRSSSHGGGSVVLQNAHVEGGRGRSGGSVTVESGSGGPTGPGGAVVVVGGSIKGGDAE